MGSGRASRPWLAITAVAASGGLVLAACSSSETAGGNDGGGGDGGGQSQTTQVNQLEPDATPKDGGKLTVALTAETNGWNPGTAQWADAGEMAGPTMLEPLLNTTVDGSFEPVLATSVEPTTPGDFTSWTIEVRPDVTFHNGEPLDAEVVARSLNFYAKEAPLSSLALSDKVDEAVAVDDMTVEVKLNVPWAAYPTVLSGASGFIMANEMLDSEDKGASSPIGTGPFEFSSWTQDKSLLVSKFDDYWQEGKPHLEEIEFRPIVDAKQRVEALRAGDVEMILTTRATDVAELKGSYTVIVDWGSERTFVMLNTASDPAAAAPNPFENAHARKALAYATNRDGVMELVSGGETLVSATSPLTGAFVMDDSQSGYVDFDQAKAREEVELYKQETGATDLTFRFSGLANLEDQQIMQYLKQIWSEVGITAEIDTAEQTAYIGQLAGGRFEAAYFRNYGYLDPDSNYYFWSCDTAKGVGELSINFSQYCDDATQAAIDTGRTNPDLAERKTAYQELTRARNDAVLDVWLFNTPYSVIAVPEVKGLNGLRQRPFGNFEPKAWLWPDVWLDR
ncbi:MAG: hypothetical protein KDB33_16240 [Acidimicrobiales bacterium]|nr:hypothetical protein [Acidimicrobiales bacterium]